VALAVVVRVVLFPDVEASGSLQRSVLADYGFTFEKATVLLYFDMHYIGTCKEGLADISSLRVNSCLLSLKCSEFALRYSHPDMSTSQWPRCLRPFAFWGCGFEESIECYRV